MSINLSHTYAVGLGVRSRTVDELLDMVAASRPAWHADAACREHPEVNFFPTPSESSVPAIEVCRGCLVEAECRSWALAQGSSLTGVRGGVSLGRRRSPEHSPSSPNRVGPLARAARPDIVQTTGHGG